MMYRTPDRLGWRPWMVAMGFLAVVSAPGAAAAEGVYFDTPGILKDFFRTSERVTFVKVETRAVATELRDALGYVPRRDSYPVFVAWTQDRIDGFAIIDEERGQHLPITFATKIAADGRVERTEVMVYREGYGDEIREARFRQQFVGKAVAEARGIPQDVVAVSGATISSRSMAVAVQRALALVGVAQRRGLVARAAQGATSQRALAPQQTP